MATSTRLSMISPSTHRVSVKQYLKMIVTNVIPHDARIELLDGILVEQMTKYAPHTFAVSEVAGAFRLILPAEDWVIREEKPLVLKRFWRPEPDVSIVRGPKGRYRTSDPFMADVGLLVEVADSTYTSDRGEKWRAYAAARIPIYWVVNLNQNRIEVYLRPAGRGKNASYHEVTMFGTDDEIPVVLDGQELGRFAVRDVLP
jgi:Uma2 family endonuclease